jgi:deoxyribodipyrimidine photo-lyase
MTSNPISIFWHRRDLRIEDNAGLYHALKSGLPVLPIFIFDKHILDNLENRYDKRVDFIHQQLAEIKKQLNDLGSDLLVFYGTPEEVWPKIINQHNVKKVFTNHDYEPYAKNRDAWVNNFFASKQITFNTYKDQCVFEYDEVLKDD